MTSISFWDNRFREPEFAYGTEPNEWFRENIEALEPGNLLLPAEGEGRNAVYAAKNLWFVTAYDSSEAGIQKAAVLARKNNVRFKFEQCTHEEFDAPNHFFDCIALIYAHMPSQIRPVIHSKLLQKLKPGGVLILEAFSKGQLGNNSGGPKDLDWLYSLDDVKSDFRGMTVSDPFITEVELNEGPYHQGIASVIRLLARK